MLHTPQTHILEHIQSLRRYSKTNTTRKTYSSAASALSTVTLSSVASRFNIPKSKYFISNSKCGNINYIHEKTLQSTRGTQQNHYTEKLNTSLNNLSAQTLSLIIVHITRVISSPKFIKAYKKLVKQPTRKRDRKKLCIKNYRPFRQ